MFLMSLTALKMLKCRTFREVDIHDHKCLLILSGYAYAIIIENSHVF